MLSCFNINSIEVIHTRCQRSLAGLGDRQDEANLRLMVNQAVTISGETVATGEFIGVCDELKEHVYDTGVGRNNAEIFSKTTKAIAEYVAREYSGAGEFRNGLPEMTLPTLTAPPPPEDTATVVQLKIWEMDFKEYWKRTEERERNMEKTYALILGQCSKTIQDRIEAHEHWDTVNTSSNALGLLRLI